MQRRAIQVHGIVQSVGFRPYVHRLATGLGLAGFVQNQAGTLLIEIEGASDALDHFCTELQEHPPALAKIETLSWRHRPTRGESHFQIKPSDGGASQIFISPDVAVCRDCLTELFDPGDRRYRYPFINCTNCGPRLTIVTNAPYDRSCGLLMAKVDFGGVSRRVCLEHAPEAKPGNYVLVHVGFALSIIDPEEAEQVFAFLKRMNELDELESDQESGP